MPLSLMVSVRACSSAISSMCRSETSTPSEESCRAASRSLSSASDELEMTSRRNVSEFE